MNIVAHLSPDQQPRVSSRDLATALNNQHSSVMRLINDHQALFEELGHLGFEIETVKNSVGAVNHSKTAYLNEDQCYFLLTLVRNSELVAKLKLTLVKAFAAARAQAIKPTQPASPLALAETILEALKQQDTRIQVLEDWKDTAPINSMQVGVIHRLGQRLGYHIGFAAVWSMFRKHFGLASYRDLPARQFEEAIAFLTMHLNTYERSSVESVRLY